MSSKMKYSYCMYGEQNFLLPSHLNYGKYVVDKILLYNDAIALIDAATQKKITFKEMAKQIVNTASCLKEEGVKQNDVVAICCENRMEYLICALAIFYSGAILTCINNNYSEDEFIHVLNLSKPKYIFLSHDTHQKYYEKLKSVNVVQIFFMFDKISLVEKTVQFEHLSTKNLNVTKCEDFYVNGGTALILYSSGTTGSAKGARITHKSLIVRTYQTLPSDVHRVMLTTIPWSSTMGLLSSLLGIFNGRTHVFLPKFKEGLYLRAIQAYKVNMLIVVPSIMVILCKSNILRNFDISSVETIYCGGDILKSTVIREIKIRFPKIKFVLQGYGMTEMTGIITKESETKHKEGSVGKIAPGVILKIVDVETRKILGNGETGEVCVKGLVIFDGYIGKDSKDVFDEDGFYKTGDIAYYDEDGYLFVVGRIKELIKYKASQVAPAELEALLLQHPAVKDVGVTGTPDVLAGELPTAFIVKQPGINVTESEIVSYIDNKVSPWKRLRGGAIFVSEIPKNASGKIIRKKLLAMIPTPVSKL